MSVFSVAVTKVLDNERFQATYAKEVHGVVHSFGGRYRMVSLDSMTLEGDAASEDATIIMIEWPDKATAMKFWNSPEYARVRDMRKGIADVRVWLVDTPWFDDSAQPLG